MYFIYENIRRFIWKSCTCSQAVTAAISNCLSHMLSCRVVTQKGCRDQLMRTTHCSCCDKTTKKATEQGRQ
jgi:hypothetical protein